MKTLLFFVFALSGNILKAGPPDAGEKGLEPSSYLKLSDQKISDLDAQAKSLLAAAFVKRQPRSLKPSGGPVGWYNKNEELCQIRWGGELSNAEFDECFQRSDWKIIPTPTYYLNAMHMPASLVECYEGIIAKHPAHFLWIPDYGRYMIIVELKNA